MARFIEIETDAGVATIDPRHVIAITRGTGPMMVEGVYLHLTSGMSIFASDTTVEIMTKIIEEYL